MIDENSTLEDVCFAVADALQVIPGDAVLTGGSAASIYAQGFYTSLDADFILSRRASKKDLENALAAIGFTKSQAPGMFGHARTQYTIDFPKGPLAVGGDYVRSTNTIERNGQILRILTPTDSVRDRLAHFFFWNDYTALATAVAIVQSSYGERVDLKAVREWVNREEHKTGADYTPKLNEFLTRAGITTDPPMPQADEFDPFDNFVQGYPMLSSDRITSDEFFYLRLDPRVPGRTEILTRSLQDQIVDVIQETIGTKLVPVTKADGVLFRLEETSIIFKEPKDASAREIWRARCYVGKTGALEFRFPREHESATEQLLEVLAVGVMVGQRMMSVLRADWVVTGKLAYKAKSDTGSLAIASEAELPIKVDLGRTSFVNFAGPILLRLQRIGGNSGELADFEGLIQRTWARIEAS